MITKAETADLRIDQLESMPAAALIEAIIASQPLEKCDRLRPLLQKIDRQGLLRMTLRARAICRNQGY